MAIVKVNLKNRSYDIVIGGGIINQLGKYIRKLGVGSDAYVITNSLIKKSCGGILYKSLKDFDFGTRFKLVPDSEKTKSLDVASAIIKDMASFDRKRRIFIIALGGGVVGDLAGFVAAIYKRGTPYIQVPTTLLAQVDSSIGGKTAVDLKSGKNLVGAFYQPKLVFTDVGLLKTLSLRQIRAGIAEVIKYGIINNPGLFGYLERERDAILRLETGALELVVRRCASIKARITGLDEREEKGIRTILNFGHTIGHAIEAAGGFGKYNHGEAVALGMLVASDISNMLGLLDKDIPKRIESLIRTVGLPVTIKDTSLERIIKAHYRDKKFIGAKNKFVLIKDIGKVLIREDVPVSIIRACITKRIYPSRSK